MEGKAHAHPVLRAHTCPVRTGRIQVPLHPPYDPRGKTSSFGVTALLRTTLQTWSEFLLAKGSTWAREVAAWQENDG